MTEMVIATKIEVRMRYFEKPDEVDVFVILEV